MSGGGSYGAFEAGALYGFLHSDKGKNFAWDVVTGVSAGSINTAAVSLWAIGDEMNMVEFLSDTWASIWTEEVFVNWFPDGIVTGVLKHSALFDTAPAFKTLARIVKPFDAKMLRRLVVTCVDVNTGATIRFNETVSDIVKAIMSSSSIPFIFPTTNWKDYDGQELVCSDGGVSYGVNIPDAINRCREIADDDSEITLDVVMCSSAGSLGDFNVSKSTVDNFMRYREIKSYYSGVADLYYFK